MIADSIAAIEAVIWAAVIGVLVLTAISAFVVAVLFAAAVNAWRHSRADRHEIGPDALRLLQDLDAHLDEHVANDPVLAAGFDRLRTAVRDEQNGETA